MTSGTNGAFFPKGKSNMLQKGAKIEWDSTTTHKYAMSLIDLSDWVLAKAITGAVDNGSGKIRITATSHGMSTGWNAHITQVGGVPNANGTWVATVIDANTFDLDDSVFSGTYTSGGYNIPLDVPEYISDITVGAVEETKDLTIASLTNILAALDAADATFVAASGSICDALLIHRNDTPAGTNDQLILIVTEGTGLPVTLNGGNVAVAFDNGASKIAQL